MLESPDVRVICFYLPQFHPTPENDEWWGKGFTEWRNVTRASALFPGHHQPRVPADFGYYDLRVPEVREEQAALARKYGVYGFCYYYYWFGGKRVLDRPLNDMLESGRPDFPFCLCWANENWSRRWDGSTNEILIEQTYTDDMAGQFIESLMPAFNDPRYIRVGGKPLLLVYHTKMLDNPKQSVSLWRQHARKLGIEDLYVCRMNTFGDYGLEEDPARQGFDACVEFPPHGCATPDLSTVILDRKLPPPGAIYDYDLVMHQSIHRPAPSFKLFRGAMPSWDNTARKPQAPTIYFGATPEKYQRWMTQLVRWTAEHHEGDERLVFVNAWNEWAEGAYLEPDARFGHRHLEATAAALQSASPGAVEPVQTMPRDSTLEAALYELGPKGSPLRNGDPLLPSATMDGAIEVVSRLDGRLRIKGWAFDRTTPFDPSHILVFRGGRLVGQTRTGQIRPDVAGQHGVATLKSGFEIMVHHSLLGDSSSDELAVFVVTMRLECRELSMPSSSEPKAVTAGSSASGAQTA